MDLEHLINSEPHLPAQRPHAAGEHIAQSGQTRQTSRHGSAMGTQGLQHVSHAATRPDPDRLIRGLPLQTMEVGLKIQGPVVGHRGPRGGPPATEPQRPGASPILNQGHQILLTGRNQTGAPRISRLRIEENGTA